MRDPRHLTEGKTALHAFRASAQFFPILRRMGHEGVCISHFCFGRALFSACARLIKQRYALVYQRGSGGQPLVGQNALDFLTDWVVCTGCCCHDVHKALKWGLATH
eukprot:11204165-Lingulodinium_polyedra.AAC.1